VNINQSESPVIRLSPQNKRPEDNKEHSNERDSMVVMGSKNLDRHNSKKKSKKIAGLGGLNNLKKNKLAIAFNNLEVEQ
jgi:hypothetical protein